MYLRQTVSLWPDTEYVGNLQVWMFCKSTFFLVFTMICFGSQDNILNKRRKVFMQLFHEIYWGVSFKFFQIDPAVRRSQDRPNLLANPWNWCQDLPHDQDRQLPGCRYIHKLCVCIFPFLKPSFHVYFYSSIYAWYRSFIFGSLFQRTTLRNSIS